MGQLLPEGGGRLWVARALEGEGVFSIAGWAGMGGLMAGGPAHLSQGCGLLMIAYSRDGRGPGSGSPSAGAQSPTPTLHLSLFSLQVAGKPGQQHQKEERPPLPSGAAWSILSKLCYKFGAFVNWVLQAIIGSPL